MNPRPGKPSSRPPADLNDYNTPEAPDKVSIDGSDQWGRGQVKFGYGSTLYGTADRAEQTGTRPSFIREGQLSYSDAQGYLGALRAKARVPNASKADKLAYSNLISSLSSYRDTKIESDSGADSAWAAMLNDASDGRVNVMDLIQSGSSGPPGGSGGSSAYTGPVSSVTKMADSDIRNIANNVSMEMIGRGVSDEEFQKIVKRTQQAEVNNPTISSGGVATNITDQGLTTVGREDIVKNIIAKQPEYAEFQKATTLMSWFDEALSGRVK